MRIVSRIISYNLRIQQLGLMKLMFDIIKDLEEVCKSYPAEAGSTFRKEI
ncbi:MAG: hypothetical protein QXP92_03510 [Nitrososphaerota archaeon]